jgi:hypothetical protein
MKTKIFLLFVLLLIPIGLFAQEPDVPASWSDLISGLTGFVSSLAGLAGIVIFITAILNTLLKLTKQWIKLVVAIAVSVLLAVLTNLLNFGLFAESTWVETIINGAGLGLVAGSIFDIPTMKVLVNLILSLLQIKK